MAEPPRIKRYALVRDSRDGSVTRLHLARRLERMERVAELERSDRNGAGPAHSREDGYRDGWLPGPSSFSA